jgi:hypothetical protein
VSANGYKNKNMNKKDILQFKVTTSKGRYTYGYTIVSLYVNGVKSFSTCGGGYDMSGTVLAQYVQANFKDRLKKLTSNHGSLDDGTGYYGLTFTRINKDTQRHEYVKNYEEGTRTNIHLDGACGWNSITRIMEAIGLQVEKVNVYKLMTYEVSYTI